MLCETESNNNRPTYTQNGRRKTTTIQQNNKWILFFYCPFLLSNIHKLYHFTDWFNSYTCVYI